MRQWMLPFVLFLVFTWLQGPVSARPSVTIEYAKQFKLTYLENGCKKITNGAGKNLSAISATLHWTMKG